MDGYDIIGDIHGSGYKLRVRLKELGYRHDAWTNAYRHADRTAIFVGDLIDRGPAQREVLEIVKAMVDSGSAQIVMGNHEFNALAYAIPDNLNPGEHLRKHSAKNKIQHEAFLSQLTKAEQAHYLSWFRTMPLWLDLGGLRVVHACWHKPSMRIIEEYLEGPSFSTFEQLALAARKPRGEERSPIYEAVEKLLKGPEMDLTSYGIPGFKDKDGFERTHARIRWWKHDVSSVRDLAEIPRDAVDEEGNNYLEAHGHGLEQDLNPADANCLYNDQTPVFYGHYWRADEPVEHEDWTSRTACVDFSAVKGGTLVAYRWDGEREIDRSHYHPHGANLVSREPSA